MGRRKGSGKSSKKANKSRSGRSRGRTEPPVKNAQNSASEQTAGAQTSPTVVSAEDVVARELGELLQLGPQPSTSHSSSSRGQSRGTVGQSGRPSQDRSQSVKTTDRAAQQRFPRQGAGGRPQEMEFAAFCKDPEALQFAAGNCDVLMLEPILRLGGDPNAEGPNGWKSMHCIAMGPCDKETEFRPTVKLLLEHNVSIDQTDRGGNTAMHLAARHGKPALLKVLLSFGADLTLKDKRGHTPLAVACESSRLNCVKTLVEQGKADVNEPLDRGMFLIRGVAEIGDEAILGYLLKKGAAANATSAAGTTPLMSAIDRSHVGCARMLVEAGANVNAMQTTSRVTVLCQAVAVGNLDVIRMLLENGADVNQRGGDGDRITPIFTACNNGHPNQKAIIKLLLCYSVDLECVCKSGTTPLICLVGRGNEQLVRMLLDAGADPSNSPAAKSHAESPVFGPLSVATSFGYHGIVKLLISRGADANQDFGTGSTALFIAAAKGDMRMVETLIESGANPNASCRDGSTAIFTALSSRNFQIAQRLAELGADVNAVSHSCDTPLLLAINYEHLGTVKKFIQCGAEVNKRFDDRSAINTAVFAGVEYVKLPIQAGADVNEIDGVSSVIHEVEANCVLQNGGSPLVLAAGNGFVQMVRALLDGGADPNIRTTGARSTPLHVCAGTGPPEVVRLLLKGGANPFLLNAEARTPLNYARSKGQQEVEEILVAAMNAMKASKPASTERPAEDPVTDQEAPDESFCCPITLDIMDDPVVAADGHTYERDAITRWIRTRGTSPVTNQRLALHALVPNFNLKHQIEQYKTKNKL